MSRAERRGRRALRALARRLDAAGASLTVLAPDLPPLRLGPRPGAARIVFCDARGLVALARRDHLRLAEAHLSGAIELSGDWSELMKVTDVLDLEASLPVRAAFALRLAAGAVRGFARRGVAFHYDRPARFFLPWFERWRSYSHGFYRSPHDDPAEAQARKLQHALDALGAKPGMRILDMGAGWGSFLEYAGLQGVRVHGITISREQHRFVSDLIRERGLPCSVELVDVRDYRPDEPFDGAVFMGTFEHVPDYARAVRFLSRHLAPDARLYADFCAQRESFLVGAFLRKWVWPGAATYVNLPELLRALIRAGWNVHELSDDTLSYACTVRDWADALEERRDELAREFGEPVVRAFLLFLRASHHFLSTNRTQAYHLVAARAPAPLTTGGAGRSRTTASAAATTATQAPPKRSPIRP